jgi:hypothetical protein
VQSRPLFALRQGHLVRLRHARRSGHGQRPADTAVHLPLIGRRHAPRVRVIEERGEAPTTQELFIKSIRARERAALADLGAVAGTVRDGRANRPGLGRIPRRGTGRAGPDRRRR